jgi:hypothetical protein
MKSLGAPLLSIICSFYRQKVSMILKSLRSSLSCVEELWQQERPLLDRLGVLPSFLPISLHDLFHAIGDEFRS